MSTSRNLRLFVSFVLLVTARQWAFLLPGGILNVYAQSLRSKEIVQSVNQFALVEQRLDSLFCHPCRLPP